MSDIVKIIVAYQPPEEVQRRFAEKGLEIYASQLTRVGQNAFKNLKHIIESIQAQGARVIIGGLKFPLRDRGFARGYKDLADETGAVLIPDIFKGIMGNRKLMSDPIHPNGDGYKLMAERFFEAMQP